MATFGTTNPFDQQKNIEGIKNIIAVGAGKGGVGKSTIATNLAVTLAKRGVKVGLLDADIYGPSIPKMMGLEKMRPNVTASKKIEPLVSHGVKTMSIGYLIEENSAVIWRGPMLFKAIDQFLRDVNWGELDYLIVDLPPGTGDVQLSLTQKVPLSGAVIVSTPQDIALIDVKRCVDMFKRLKIPILGLIENMTTFSCPHCHESSKLFQSGDLHAFCLQAEIPILGGIPFNAKVGEASEKGEPFSLSSGSEEEASFNHAAGLILEKTTSA